MASLQAAAELPDRFPLAHRLHSGDDFGGELLPFHTGHCQCLLQLFVQAGDALGDHSFHPGR